MTMPVKSARTDGGSTVDAMVQILLGPVSSQVRSFSAGNSRYSPTSTAQYLLPDGELAEARP
jgi:hypothetical protein